MIVADRNGVVVVPFLEIDAVAERVQQVKRLEEELEAKVAEGFCEMATIGELIQTGKAKIVE